MRLDKVQKDKGPWSFLLRLWPFCWIYRLWYDNHWKIKLRSFALKFCPRAAFVVRILAWKFQPKRMRRSRDIAFSKKQCHVAFIPGGPKVAHQRRNRIFPLIVNTRKLIFLGLIEEQTSFFFIKTCLSELSIKRSFLFSTKFFSIFHV